MICHACALGSEYNTRNKYAFARVAHEACEGCSCQHLIGGGWVKKEAPRAYTHEASKRSR